MKSRWVLLSLFLVVALSSGQVPTPVPVLCYHGFSDDTTGAGGKLTEQYARFEAMLRFLARSGYRTAFPEEMPTLRETTLRPVVVTFDDGRKDQMRAAEMMNRYGFKGIFFIIPARIKETPIGSMTPSDLRQLVRWGHRVGVHGFAHKSLPSSVEEADSSVSASLDRLASYLPEQTAFPNFAFPFGHYDTVTFRRTAAVYSYLHTVNPGYWDGFSNVLPRMLITSDQPFDFFKSYVLEAALYQPLLMPVTPDGATADTVEFRSSSSLSPQRVELLSVSADREGYHYAIHPTGSALRTVGSKVLLDLREHLEIYYHDTRGVISYALIERRPQGGIMYVSPGVMHWVVR